MDQVAADTPVASPDSPQDQCDSAPASSPSTPNNLSVLLHAVGILLTYGRHLIDTIRQRTTTPNFEAIAACFGTGNIDTIIAYLNRGILRAAALEKVLLARAATGRDMDVVQPRSLAPQEPPAAAGTPPEQPATETPSPERIRVRVPRPAGWDNPALYMPTPEDLERQVRRAPVGRTILNICLDLGVVPGFCHSAFWNELMELITLFGSTVNKIMVEKSRRWKTFDQEQDRIRDRNWDWIGLSRPGLRQVLGFFIGEPPLIPP